MTDPTPTQDPPGAPEHWEADVVLSDGRPVHLRPVRPTDGAAIAAMHARASDRTRYQRYFTAVGPLSDAQVALFTTVDQHDAIGLVAQYGDELVAVGTCHRDPADRGSAEVAFVVEDTQQRRGLGSVLLEHLAAAAAERGITRFTASVLAGNTGMLRLFADAGYLVHREISSGIVDLVFDIASTRQSRAVARAREQRAEARSVAGLLTPRTVAVLGASDRPGVLGSAVLSHLLAGGFTGAVYPVSPHAHAVQGVRAYPQVSDIPDQVDLAVLAVPAAAVSAGVAACRRQGVRGLIVMTGGFADAGSGGAAAQRRLVADARAGGMRVVGPNCLGVVNTDPAVRLNATLAPVLPPAGRVGFFCQSGALGIAILADAAARGLGLSSFVSAGNRADVSGNDLLQFWQSDPRTDVVLLYLESFGNPRKFARLARALTRTKPVIAVRSGRHAVLGAGLAATSRLLPEATVAGLFAGSGVIRTATLSEAFDVAALLAHQPVPRGDRVTVIGNSTALGVLVLDACRDAGLEVTGGTPIDLGAAVSPDDLGAAVHQAVTGEDTDAVVVVFYPPVAVTLVEHAQALRAAAAASPIPVLTTFVAQEGLAAALTVPDGNGGAARGSVPSFRTPERAVAALSHAVRYGHWLSRPAGEVATPTDVDPDTARALAQRWWPPAASAIGGVQGDRWLTDDELIALLRCYGVEVAEFELARDVDTAVEAAGRLGYPVALKTSEQSRRHRLDRSGIRLGCGDAEAVRRAHVELTGPAADGSRQSGSVYVQVMAPPDRAGIPTVLGITGDPSFGSLVFFGVGGVTTDLLGDRAYRSVPLTDLDAAALIDEPRAAPLLSGYRGSRPVDRGALAELARRVSALAEDIPEVVELQLEPVLAGPGGVCVTGATARIAPPGRTDDRRRLG